MAEAHWNERGWRWAAWLGVPTAILWISQIARPTAEGFKENGIIENAQVVLWLLSIVASIVVVVRIREKRSRWGTALLGAMAGVALARELDLHIALNPQELGPWGVRYRLDWWMDGEVPLGLKLAWKGIALGVAAMFGVMIIKARQPVRWASARIRLLIGAAVMLFLGFFFDDLMRGRIPIDIAQRLEETAELIGPLLYLGAVLSPESADRAAGEP